MTYDHRPGEEEGDHHNMMFHQDDMLRWSSHPQMGYANTPTHQPHNPMEMELPLQAVVPSTPTTVATAAASAHTTTAPITTTNTSNVSAPLPTGSTTNPMLAPPPPMLDPAKQYHPEWGVIKDQDFHPLTLKHQRDLENLFSSGQAIADFYFWQANLGGYCMANMVQGFVVSSEGAFTLERKIVEGAPHPGRRKKKRSGAGSN